MRMMDRLRAAAGIVMKGSLFPFNKLLDYGNLIGGEKLDKPFAKSAWVMRAIKIISGPIAAVNIQFALNAEGAEQFLNDAELVDFWAAPARTAAAEMTFYDFIEANVAWLKLEGEAFWILDDTWLVPFPEARTSAASPIVMARPDRMKQIVKAGALIGWEFTDGNNRKHALLPEQVVHPMFHNPYDDFRGLGEFEAARVAAEADFLAGKFNLNLMRNNGDQGVYIVAKGGIPDEAQRTQIVAQLREKRELSQRGIFKPFFLAGDISIEDSKVRAPDAAFIAGRMENKHEIFSALGVPPSMSDVTASYSIGSASDRFRLIEDTCMPLGERLANHIEQVELKRSGRKLHASFDWSKHSVMQQVRQEYLKAADGLWAKGMPMEDINDYLRLGMRPFAGWDVGYLPFNVTPVTLAESGLADPVKDPAFEEPSGAAAIRRALKLRIADQKNSALTPTPLPQGEGDPNPEWEVFQKARPAKEVAAWRTHMAQRRPIVQAFRTKFNSELFKARAEVLRKIESVRSDARSVSPHPSPLPRGEGVEKAAAADFMFDLEAFRTGVLGSMRKVAATALQTAGKQFFEEIGKDDPFAMPPGRVLTFLRERENKLNGVADEVFDQVKGKLEEGINAGDSIKQLADRVRSEFNDLSRGRATTIAMTETAAAYGTARDEGMKQAGIQYKEWLTSGNPNVRPAHAEANGQTVGVDETFSVDGEELLFPGDPHGSPGNVINCHCVSIAVDKPEESDSTGDNGGNGE